MPNYKMNLNNIDKTQQKLKMKWTLKFNVSHFEFIDIILNWYFGWIELQ